MTPQDTHPPLDYHHIAHGIFIGTNVCCQVHFDERLLKEGITADISLEEEQLDAPYGVEFFLWLPVKDGAPPTPDQLELGVSALTKLVDLKKKVYVHCRLGHGRAPTLVAAYLVSKGKTAEEAEATVRAQRPVTHLEPAQQKALRAYQKSL